MGKIALLDQNTINQIAAGEVIERPAAVVKELVENAIDAGASAVTVEIKEGGTSFIRITDNGSGILDEDIPLVFLRNSTSKIRSATDLLTVTSLGFRGEALSSVASIAQVELVTKTADSLTGIRYEIAGGEEICKEEIGCPNGTTFIIRNLFFNTPARRKFLKSPTTEAGYIQDIMERLSVSHDNVSFKFINNNQVKLHTSGNSNQKDILYHVYGREVVTHLEPVSGACDDLRLEGYIAKPIVTRGNRNYENYFINGRYIKSGLIYKAIEEAYKPYIMQHRYPFTSLHIEINPELIDVNVHPAKLEIRFKNSDDVYQLVYNSVKTALEGKILIPKVVLTEEKEVVEKIVNVPEPFEVNRINRTKIMEDNPNLLVNVKRPKPMYEQSDEQLEKIHSELDNLFGEEPLISEKNIDNHNNIAENSRLSEKNSKFEDKIQVDNNSKFDNNSQVEIGGKTDSDILKEDDIYGNIAPVGLEIKETVITSNLNTQKAEQLSFLSEEAKIKHRIIGQVFRTFWLVEYGDTMFMIDQHAAHEKVMYEKIVTELKAKEILSQMLEPPIIINVTMREEEVLLERMSLFERLGFEIEDFGGNSYALRGVPSNFYSLNVKEIFTELLDGLVEDGFKGTPDIILEKMASMSCKAAIKGNTNMSFEEADELITLLLTLENPYHCPHGRPTIISMSKYEMEKKFKRIV